MNLKKIEIWFTVFACFVFLAANVNAQQGAPFFQMYVGNYWEYQGTETPGGGTWIFRETVVALDQTTVPGQTTYKVEGSESETVWEKSWYSINQTDMRLWRIEYLEEGNWDTVELTNGIRVAKNPLVVGDSWIDNTTATFNGTPIDITSQCQVESYENITIPLGTYQAYKINRTIIVPQLGGVVEESSYWVVPYIGIIKQVFIDEEGNQEIEELNEMRIRKTIVDFDSDAKTDISVYRRDGGGWYILPSSGTSPYGVGWGGDKDNDIPVPVDYDGDGKTDIAIYRAQTGAWYIIPSSNPSAPYGIGWGGDKDNDIPVPGDYDGDGKADIAIYRRNIGVWFILPSGVGSPYGVGWGGDDSDIPLLGDYDGDGKTDIAVYRKSDGGWYIIPSSNPTAPYGVGWGGDDSDIPVPGDYDGDGKTDIAVYRGANGGWYVIPSSGASPYGLGWGGDATDIPVPGDYDGDGKTDIAIYRRATGGWYVVLSSNLTPYGLGWGGDATDVPLSTNPACYMKVYEAI